MALKKKALASIFSMNTKTRGFENPPFFFEFHVALRGNPFGLFRRLATQREREREGSTSAG